MGMMEFYSESEHRAIKEHVCACCNRKINPGDMYFRESGKWCGDFFTRALHPSCHFMEVKYCNDIDNEFSWDGVTDHIQDVICGECEHAACHDDLPGWKECPYSMCVEDCHIVKEKLFKEYGYSQEVITNA